MAEQDVSQGRGLKLSKAVSVKFSTTEEGEAPTANVYMLDMNGLDETATHFDIDITADGVVYSATGIAVDADQAVLLKALSAATNAAGNETLAHGDWEVLVEA